MIGGYSNDCYNLYDNLKISINNESYNLSFNNDRFSFTNSTIFICKVFIEEDLFLPMELLYLFDIFSNLN